MVDLRAKTACDGLLPLKIGKVSAVERDLEVLSMIMPYKGQDKPLSDALQAAHGMPGPEANRTTGDDKVRAIWFGRGQLLLAGSEPDATLAQHAAISTQSDAWAVVELSGDGAQDVLARLIPVDLRVAAFPTGHTARTVIQHMNGSVTRLGEDRFLLMVFRSMAATLVHDLQDAMETVAARD